MTPKKINAQLRNRREFATVEDIKRIALQYMIDFVRKDQDARTDIRVRAGMVNSQPCIDMVNDALTELAEEMKRAKYTFKRS